MTRCASKKGSHLMFDNNFGKCGPIFKILSPTDSWENAPCFHQTLLGDHQPADQGTNHCVSRAQVTVTYTVNCWFRPIFNFCTSFAPLFEVLLVLWNFQTPNRTGAAVSVNPRLPIGQGQLFQSTHADDAAITLNEYLVLTSWILQRHLSWKS